MKFRDILESTFSFKELSQLIKNIPNNKGDYLNWKSNGEWEFSSKKTELSYNVDDILTYSDKSEKQNIMAFLQDATKGKIK